jgi:hypothetical protein
MVDGVPWPYLPVDKITYRLCTLDVSITRPFHIKFLAIRNLDQQAWLPFWIVQTDGGNCKDDEDLQLIECGRRAVNHRRNDTSSYHAMPSKLLATTARRLSCFARPISLPDLA